MIIKARAPLRLGLAGGGTDLASYSNEYGGCVLNVTIDKYAYAMIRENTDKTVTFGSVDLEQYECWPVEEVELINQGLKLHKAVYSYIMNKYNDGRFLCLDIKTFCEVQAGSGLGSSSAVVVAMVKAFVELLNLPLAAYDIAKTAFHIERVMCGLAGGKQDQYAASFGGFNFMEFRKDGHVNVTALNPDIDVRCELESSTVLYFTGVSRESENIIKDQNSNTINRSLKTLDAMHAMKKEAEKLKECLLTRDLDGVFKSMKVGWENKKASAASVSNPEIDTALEVAMSSGASAVKVSGAGGGGFIMLFVPVELRFKVSENMKELGGQILTAGFTDVGCQSWSIR